MTLALNPVYTVVEQLVETIRRHTPATAAQARARALELLRLGPDPLARATPEGVPIRGLLGANIRPGQRERPLASPGSPPNLAGVPDYCAFARAARSCKPRCWQAVPSLAALDDQHAARCVLVDDHA
jgi:ABC-type dipeptide/oligopeptide/nickel transport system ATPase component